VVSFDQVNLIVSDMEASAAFYRRLGFELPDDGTPWAAHHRELSTDVGSIDLDSERSLEIWGGGIRAKVVIGFKLPTREAVDELWADLTGAGYESAMAPGDANWGSRYAIVVDPDGNHVGLMSPQDPGLRSAWPDP
jgi:catechol 2,3-dioxygenase-like lactoylglutathione lyase family enzyme